METNLYYQRRLAETLVTGLGIEAAMDFARRNDRDGVLAQMCATGAPDGDALWPDPERNGSSNDHCD